MAQLKGGTHVAGDLTVEGAVTAANFVDTDGQARALVDPAVEKIDYLALFDTNTRIAKSIVKKTAADEITVEGSQVVEGSQTVQGNLTAQSIPLAPEHVIRKTDLEQSIYLQNQLRSKFNAYKRDIAVKTWYSSPLPSTVSTNAWRSTCWSSELSLFVAVSSDGTYRVMTSSDGIAWTVGSAAEANEWYSVCWSPELGLFVAVARTGTNRVMTSSNGIDWTARAVPAMQWSSVCWSADLGMFVAVAYGSLTNVMYSYDGITWTSSFTSTNVGHWTSVCWSPKHKMFMAVADSFSSDASSELCMISSDGINWSYFYIMDSEFDTGFSQVVWSTSLELFIALSYQNNGEEFIIAYITSPEETDFAYFYERVPGEFPLSICDCPDLGIVLVFGDSNLYILESKDEQPISNSARSNLLSLRSFASNNLRNYAPAETVTCWSSALGKCCSARYGSAFSNYPLYKIT